MAGWTANPELLVSRLRDTLTLTSANLPKFQVFMGLNLQFPLARK
jgi:hypothetical protein